MQYAKESRGEIQSMQDEIEPNIGKVEFLKFSEFFFSFSEFSKFSNVQLTLTS